MITKKDFEKIAFIIRHNKVDEVDAFNELNINGEALIEDLCDYFRNENPLFNEEKFKKACGVEQ